MIRGTSKELRPLLRRLRAAGATVAHGGKHPKVYYQGRFICTLPGTPGDRRSIRNTEAQLRRAGVLTNQPKGER